MTSYPDSLNDGGKQHQDGDEIRRVHTMSIAPFRRTVLILCLGGGACGDDDKILERVERFCVVGDAREEGVVYDESVPLEITVQFANCRNDCYEVSEASCEATLDGFDVEVAAVAHLRKYRRICDPVCNIVNTECDLAPLSAGEYVFSASDPAAGRELEVIVPVPSVAPVKYCTDL